MASIDLIRASNGSGDAVKATVTNARVISSTTIQVDATTNWPSKFIAAVGNVDGTGAFVPATVTVFNGILSGGNIEITSFAPGYTDLGNTPEQVVVLKPTTAWANEMANTLAVSHNDNGTMKANSVTTTAITDANVTTAKIANNAVIAGKIDFTTFGTVDANGWKDFGTFWYKRYNATNNTSISANANIYVDTISSSGNPPVGGGAWSSVSTRAVVVAYAPASATAVQTGLIVTPDTSYAPGFFVFNGGSAAATFGTRPITIMIFKS